MRRKYSNERILKDGPMSTTAAQIMAMQDIEKYSGKIQRTQNKLDKRISKKLRKNDKTIDKKMIQYANKSVDYKARVNANYDLLRRIDIIKNMPYKDALMAIDAYDRLDDTSPGGYVTYAVAPESNHKNR